MAFVPIKWAEKLISGLLSFLVVIRLPLIAAMAVLFSEWLFIITKPSFLSPYSSFEKIVTLLQIGIFSCGGISLALLSVFLLVSSFHDRMGRKILIFLATLIGTLLLTTLTVMMLDNFTYTLLGFGIRSIHSKLTSIVVSVFIILLFVKIFGWCKTLQVQASVLPRVHPVIGVTALVVCFGVLALRSISITSTEVPRDQVMGGSQNSNIIIIGMDAVEASHMSIYGYQKDTTPFLKAKRTEFLISENSFTNHSPSYGSIGSLLTGKYATTTRLIFPPDKLTGKDQFEHLPGILHSAGYRSLDLSLRWYADPVDMNIRCGFEVSNFRTVSDCDINSDASNELLTRFDLPLILIEQIKDRVTERIEILNPWVELAPNPDGLLRVGQPAFYWHKDQARIQATIEFIEHMNDQPFFINLHLMGTHGPIYLLDKRHFSLGQKQTGDWQDDFYDDAIREADSQIEIIYQKLKSIGLLEETVIVVTSDHGRSQRLETRLPLMIRFPHVQHSRNMRVNTQRLDIAPTLLDFIDLPIPNWMEGRSLIANDSIEGEQKSIIQTRPSRAFDRVGKGSKSKADISLPFFSLGGINIIECDQLFSWDLEANTFQKNFIRGHTQPCENNRVFLSTYFVSIARTHLLDRNYDLKSLTQPRELIGIDAVLN